MDIGFFRDLFNRDMKNMGRFASVPFYEAGWIRIRRDPDSCAEQYVSTFYSDMRTLYKVPLSFEEFRERLFFNPRWRYWGRPEQKNGSFRQRPDIKKKVLTEDQKRKEDWRNHKKVRKEKAKSYFGWGAKTWVTTQGHRKMRRWCKQRLKAGDYSLSHGWKKSFINPWDWD